MPEWASVVGRTQRRHTAATLRRDSGCWRILASRRCAREWVIGSEDFLKRMFALAEKHAWGERRAASATNAGRHDEPDHRSGVADPGDDVQVLKRAEPDDPAEAVSRKRHRRRVR